MFDDMYYGMVELFRETGITAPNATLIKLSGGEYDPSIGEVVSTPQEIAVQAIVMDLTLRSNGLADKAGTLISAGDKEAHILPNHDMPFNIVPDDILVVAGTSYKVATVKETNPTGNYPILFSVYLRR